MSTVHLPFVGTAANCVHDFGFQVCPWAHAVISNSVSCCLRAQRWWLSLVFRAFSRWTIDDKIPELFLSNPCFSVSLPECCRLVFFVPQQTFQTCCCIQIQNEVIFWLVAYFWLNPGYNDSQIISLLSFIFTQSLSFFCKGVIHLLIWCQYHLFVGMFVTETKEMSAIHIRRLVCQLFRVGTTLQQWSLLVFCFFKKLLVGTVCIEM